MKRIKLKHGTAKVDDNCPKETIEALNELSEKAYNSFDLQKEPIDHAFEMANRIQCLAIEFEAFGMIQMAYDPTFKHNTDEEIKKIIPTAVVRRSSLELVELHLIDKHHIQHIIDWCAEVKSRKDEIKRIENLELLNK